MSRTNRTDRKKARKEVRKELDRRLFNGDEHKTDEGKSKPKPSRKDVP